MLVKNRMMVYQDRLRIDTHTEGQTHTHAHAHTHRGTDTNGKLTHETYVAVLVQAGWRADAARLWYGWKTPFSFSPFSMPKTVGFYHDRLGTNAEEKLRENA